MLHDKDMRMRSIHLTCYGTATYGGEIFRLLKGGGGVISRGSVVFLISAGSRPEVARIEGVTVLIIHLKGRKKRGSEEIICIVD